jgi:glycosyltransferase involved in cell wall biosynthesis
MTSIQHISILVPLYNEEQGFIRMMERLDNLIMHSSEKINILLIDDGSKDSTAELIEKNIEGKENYSAIFYQEILDMPRH